MTGQSYHHRPWPDRANRRLKVLEIQRLIETGRYQVSAEQVADAVLEELGLEDPDCSSYGGLDADAR